MAKINLNSILSETKNAVERIEETVEVAQQPLPDFDAILMEWSWRCDKGYPDFNNKVDRFKLQEVLDEMGIELPFKRLTEAPADNINLFPKSFLSKLKQANKLNLFIEYLKLFPGGDAIEKVSDGINKICLNKSNETILVEIFKSKKSLDDLKTINPSDGINALLYKIRPSGTGPGEILISWYIIGAMFQGGTVSYDIDYNGQHWEVKSLISSSGGSVPDSIDPANYGKISNYKFAQEIQAFFVNVIDPFFNNELRDSLMSLSENDSVKNKLSEISNIIEAMPRYSASGKTLLSTSIGEMTPSLFNSFYEGITKIHKLLPSSVKDVAKSSRIVVKTDSTNAQYWIDPDDVNDITKNAGKDTTVSIKVGNEITDENKEAKIWFANLMNNVFVKNPKYFIDNLQSIRDGFASGKEGLIYITKNSFNISYGMDKFFTSHITRATFRFELKGLNKYENYTYAKEQ